MTVMKTKATFGELAMRVERDGTPTIKRGFGKPQPLCGITVELLTGPAVTSRMTATRVVTGAALAGPVGALLGGMARKRSGGEALLTVAGPGLLWSVKVDPEKLTNALSFVAKANQLSDQYCTSPMSPT
jgi:hypothetical protein